MGPAAGDWEGVASLLLEMISCSPKAQTSLVQGQDLVTSQKWGPSPWSLVGRLGVE